MAETQTEGLVRVLGLQNWWSNELEEIDRQAIHTYFGPGQAETAGQITWTSQSRISLLTTIATWLNKEQTRFTAYRCLQKTDELWPDDASALDRHFALQHRCQVYYRWRDVDNFALGESINACRRSIAMHKEAAQAFRTPGPMPWQKPSPWGIPGHHCFWQLVVIEDKRKNYDEAIRLCEEAQAEGWFGDWAKRITKLEGKKTQLAGKGQH